MYDRVLVALDGSPSAELALRDGVEQARAFRSELVLLRVVPLTASSPILPDASLVPATTSAPDLAAATAISTAEADAHAYLESLAAPLREQGLPVTSAVRIGPEAGSILKEAAERQIGLIVLATHGRSGIARLFLGSVADEVVHHAPCAVLLLRLRPELPTAPRPDATSGHVRSFRDDAEAVGALAPRPLGIRTVEIARIVGSVGRAHELGPDFLPVDRRRRPEFRLLSIRKAMERGEVMPPIELYKLGYHYYVLDGNHRVAAARQIGQVDMDALVTEFIPVDDEQSNRLFAERRAFETATGLTRVGARRVGHYHRLEQLIRDYAAEVGVAEEVDDEATLKAAAARWYSNVFYPIAQRLRAAHLSDCFPGDRTADIVVHLADFRANEAQRQGRDIAWDEAVRDFLAAYGRSRVNVLEHLPGLRSLLRARRSES